MTKRRPRLVSLPPRIEQQRAAVPTQPISARRITGNELQRRRLSMWRRSPRCAQCKRLTDYPNGFALDHIQPLHAGGLDVLANLQVLCHQCHDAKTRREARGP